MPNTSRQTLARRVEAEERKLEKLRQEGASSKKLQKVEQKKTDTEQQLRSAGGWTTQPLGLSNTAGRR
jgi:hypothetical protein